MQFNLLWVWYKIKRSNLWFYCAASVKMELLVFTLLLSLLSVGVRGDLPPTCLGKLARASVQARDAAEESRYCSPGEFMYVSKKDKTVFVVKSRSPLFGIWILKSFLRYWLLHCHMPAVKAMGPESMKADLGSGILGGNRAVVYRLMCSSWRSLWLRSSCCNSCLPWVISVSRALESYYADYSPIVRSCLFFKYQWTLRMAHTPCCYIYENSSATTPVKH